MVKSYTAKYTRISSGYMGQLVEWPEVITEGKNIEECRELLRDAVHEMILAYKQQGREIPPGGDLLEQVPIERRDLFNYLVQNGFTLLREGKKHSIYTNGMKMIPVKRHRVFDRITANELCKQSGLTPKF
mgnify:CR=1 FL=1